jgi:hypothetical protein
MAPWNGFTAWPSVVVASGKTATDSPARSTSATCSFTRAASRQLPRTMNMLPKRSAIVPMNGHVRVSDLATKRIGPAAFRRYTSSQDT